MKNLVEFLQDIYRQDWQLWNQNGQLCYDAPQDQSTELILATLKEHKTEILQLLPAYQDHLTHNLIAETDLIPPVVIPLSEAQKVLWLLDQLEGNGKPIFVESVCLQLEGTFDRLAMEQAIPRVVQRHEALRTRIYSWGDYQEILPGVRIEVPLIDFSQVPVAERETQVTEWLEQAMLEPFSINQAPLLQVYILKLENTLHRLVLKINHIIADGFSLEIILRELAALYAAQCQGTSCQLSTPMQFREYIELQNQPSHQKAIAKQEAYWLEKFADAIPLLNLPTDRPRPPIISYRGASQTLKLDAQFCAQLKKLSRSQHCTLFMTLLTSYKILLHKLTGDEDLVVGIPTSGRNLEESHNLVGYCANLLPIRTNLFAHKNRQTLTFSELLIQIRGILLDDYEHQDYLFSQLVNKLNPQRDLSRPALTSTVFNLNSTQKAQQIGNLLGLKTSLVSLPKHFVAYDLFLDITEAEGELFLDLYYNLDLFDDRTIQRWLGHFQNLLSAIVANPQQEIANLHLLKETEGQQILKEWNHSPSIPATNKSIPQLFEEQVEKTPNAVAVVWKKQQLTYQELNYRANQLAHHLQSLGVAPEVLVGICVERSIEMIVGLLGILKAGGAYVPLDPNYPSERLAYMVADAEISVLLTQNKWISQLPSHQAKIICLDSDWDRIALSRQENPLQNHKFNNLAYIIYTSGSTGQPKGVMITHEALSHFSQTAITEYQITKSDRVLQFASINFDAAVEEIYPSLCSGATLILRTQEMLADVKRFFQACQDWQLTVLDLPTAYWHQLIADLPTAEITLPESLRLVIIGGEKVLPEPVRYWQEYVARSGKSDRLQLINTYGPTETTVSATRYRIPAQVNATTNEIPIGRPLAHLKTYILNPDLQPVPIGVAGELYLGGTSLALGYLNRPQLTSEKFIPNPFSNSPGERLYKTGDLARYLGDRNIEFLGRIDNQIKLRGFRIELGEIETALNSHPQIKQAVVIAQEEIPGAKRLIAYLVTSGETVTSNQLRGFLQQKLPEYMIPTEIVILERLPLTVNGKLDHKALPQPAIAIRRESEYLAPRTPEEAIIAQIFSQVLAVPQVGINDNFFDLGGHSLMAVRVMFEFEQQFQKTLPLATLFQNPTVEHLANFLSSTVDSINSLIVPLKTSGNQAPLFLIHPAGGKMVCC